MVTPESIRILAPIVAIVLLLMSVKRPVWGVISYMVLVYCKVAGYYPIFAAIKGELLFAAIVFTRLIFSGGYFKLSIKYNSVNKFMLMFFLSVFWSFLFAIDYAHSWDWAVYHFIKSILLYAMLVLSLNDLKDIKIFVWSFIVLFTFLAFEPMFYFLTGAGGNVQAYGVNYIAKAGILSGHVALANNMNQMIPIVFYLIQSVKKKVFKIIPIVCLTIFFVALVGSGSRGGVVGFAVFSACLVYFSEKRVRNAIVVGGCVLLLFVFSGSLSSTASRIDSSATEGRLIGIIHGIEMIRLKGHIFGVGPGCFMIARKWYFSYRMMSHNIYGQVIGELGIPGTICWILLIVNIFRNLNMAQSTLKSLLMKDDFLYKLAIGLQVSLIVRLFISLASHSLYYFYWYVIAGLSIAIQGAVQQIEEQKVERKPVWKGFSKEDGQAIPL